MMVSQDAALEATDRLRPSYFLDPRHRLIFQAAADLAASGKPVEIVTVLEALTESKKDDAAGGAIYLGEILGEEFTSASIGFYVDLMLTQNRSRMLHVAVDEMKSRLEAGDPPETVIELGESRLFALRDFRKGSGPVLLSEAIPEAVSEIERRQANQVGLGIPTGFQDLDQLVLGFHPGELTVVAARPSVGKTAFAVTCAVNAASKGFVPIVFSLEMTTSSLVERLIASGAHIDSQILRGGIPMEGDQWDRVVEATGKLSSLEMLIDDTGGQTALQIRARIRKAQAELGGRLGVAFVDYAQLIASTGEYESRRLELDAAVKALKDTAKEMKIPVVLLAQLRRPPQGSEGRRPYLSDLKETGALEEDGDLVILLHRRTRPERPSEDAPFRFEEFAGQDLIEVVVAKQRNGPIGLVRLGFIRQETRFVDHA